MLETRRIATVPTQRRLIGGLLASTLAGLLAQVGGCTSLQNDAPLDDAGTFEGGGDGSSAACPACRISQCTALQATCFDSAGCTKVATCAHKPNCDAACQAACLCEDPLAQTLYLEVVKCDDNARCTGACKTQCVSTTCPATKPTSRVCDADGGDAGPVDSGADAAALLDAAVEAAADGAVDSGVAPPTESCASCAGRCSNELNKCPLLSECSEYLQCALACGTPACVDQCGATRASGKAIVREIARCMQISCSAACGL